MDGRGAARFNIVPDWAEGTAEFDLLVSRPVRRRLPVLSIGHHLDLSLALEERDGEPGLVLQTQDTRPKQPKDAPVGTQSEMREAFGPLSGGPGRWHRVVVVWDLGQYRLYADGKQIAAIEGAVRIRRRDDTILEPGVSLGGESGGPAAGTQLDNFVVYDWAFAPEEAASRKRTDQLQPLIPKARREPTVWVWGSFPRKVVVGMNARGVPRWEEMGAVRITLYERRPFGRRQLGQVEVGVQAGVALAAIPHKPVQAIESAAGAEPDDGEDAEPDTLDTIETGEADDLDDMVDKLDVGQPYTIVVQPLPEARYPLERSVNLTAGQEGVDQRRW